MILPPNATKIPFAPYNTRITWRPCTLLDKTELRSCEPTMRSPFPLPRLHPSKAMFFLLAAALFAAHLLIGQSTKASTAWRQGAFHIDRKAIVERSDIILQSPNESPGTAMPLGNGRLGLAVWAQDGYTAQLNRGDTFPHRLSPGRVIIPGLSKLVGADNYSGRLSLYDGEFRQSGRGMTAITYVDESLDVMVIDVTGATPKVPQSAELRLWPSRKPQALLNGRIGVLADRK